MRNFLLLLFILTVGCSHHEPTVNRASNEAQTSTVRWGSEELNEMSRKMVQVLLSSSSIDFSADKTYYFGNIKNDSHDHINTKALAQKIKTALTKSAKFTFTKKVTPPYDYIFKGKVSSIFKKNQNSKDMFFNFNLSITERKTSMIIWSHSVELRKCYTRPLFSW
jgi:PBP1b-binding outer membrane lipoprotein LpoB